MDSHMTVRSVPRRDTLTYRDALSASAQLFPDEKGPATLHEVMLCMHSSVRS